MSDQPCLKSAQKQISGNRVAAISPAGFECVGVADALESGDSGLQLAKFSDATQKTVATLFEQSGLKKIMDVKNPLDITPATSYSIYTETIKAMMHDPGIDAVVVSLGSFAPATSDAPDADDLKGFVTTETSLSSHFSGRSTCDHPALGPRLNQRVNYPLFFEPAPGESKPP